MMPLAIGARIKSLRADKDASTGLALEGTVVGYGTLMWPRSHRFLLHCDEAPQLVYLVQITQGSSALGPACAVFRWDQVVEIPQGVAHDAFSQNRV